MGKLAHTLIKKGDLKSDRLIDAFSEIQRNIFVEDRFEMQSEANIPLPVGFGQIIPQPSLCATLLELLDVQSGQKILHIGSNVGWMTAILCYVVSPNGRVVATETIEGLLRIAQENVSKYSFIRRHDLVEFHAVEQLKQGFAEEAPYDRILLGVLTGARQAPQELREQLKIGGKLVAPFEDSIAYIERTSHEEFSMRTFGGYEVDQLIRKED
jgi:protein-L-isoaspartate(D-aspartate) O-methyltransferase